MPEDLLIPIEPPWQQIIRMDIKYDPLLPASGVYDRYNGGKLLPGIIFLLCNAQTSRCPQISVEQTTCLYQKQFCRDLNRFRTVC